MNTQPLQAFSLPQGLSQFSLAVSPAGSLEILLALVFALWLVFTLVAVYHWIKYSHGSPVALPAILLHLAVSTSLMSFALTGSFIPLP